MSDTPRTDAVTTAFIPDYVRADFARTLEREIQLLVRVIECLPLGVEVTHGPRWEDVLRIIEATKGYRHE